jgi:hypothetical protein
MNKPYQDILTEILTVINYTKDKKVYAEEAEKSVFTDAFINLSEKLPDDIKQQIEAAKTDFKPFTEQDIEKVRQHITPEDLTREVERLEKEDIKDFVQELTPKVNAEQKTKLDAIVASLDEAPVAPDTTATPPVTPPQAEAVAAAPAPSATPQENTTT